MNVLTLKSPFHSHLFSATEKAEQTKADRLTRGDKKDVVLHKKLKFHKSPLPAGHHPARRPVLVSREWHGYGKDRATSGGRDLSHDVMVQRDQERQARTPSPYWTLAKRDRESSSSSSASDAFWLEDFTQAEKGQGQPVSQSVRQQRANP